MLAISIEDFTEVTLGRTQVDDIAQVALGKVKAYRPNFRLDAVEIKVGHALTFSRDDSMMGITQSFIDYAGTYQAA